MHCDVRNLQYASNLLDSTGIIGVIEPINNYSLPGYYMNSYEKGAIQIYADYREKIAAPTHRTEPKSINNTVHECNMARCEIVEQCFSLSKRQMPPSNRTRQTTTTYDFFFFHFSF